MSAQLSPDPVPCSVWNLATEARALHDQCRALGERKTAHTLLREGALRAVLVALAEHERLNEHQAPGPLTIHLLVGGVEVVAGRDRYELEPGGLLVLPAGQMHSVTAHEDSTLLLTFAHDG